MVYLVYLPGRLISPSSFGTGPGTQGILMTGNNHPLRSTNSNLPIHYHHPHHYPTTYKRNPTIQIRALSPSQIIPILSIFFLFLHLLRLFLLFPFLMSIERVKASERMDFVSGADASVRQMHLAEFKPPSSGTGR